jgi:putative ABC transport system permease protein
VGQHFPNVTAIGLREALDMFGTIMGGIADAVRAAASIAVVTGMLVLAGSLMASRSQRTYDIVVLKVLGAPRRLLLLSFLFEFALLGLCAGGVALGLGTLISWAVLQGMMDLPWQFFPLPALQTLLASLAITLALGWLITGNVLRSSAAQHLRNMGE